MSSNRGARLMKDIRIRAILELVGRSIHDQHLARLRKLTGDDLLTVLWLIRTSVDRATTLVRMDMVQEFNQKYSRRAWPWAERLIESINKLGSDYQPPEGWEERVIAQLSNTEPESDRSRLTIERDKGDE